MRLAQRYNIRTRSLKSIFLALTDHSKNMFVEGRGIIEKQTKTNRGRGVSACVYVRFLKKNVDLKNEVLSLFSSFPIDCNGSMKH